jgi:flagellin-like protein
MKGITPVIAIILLLLITISLVGFSFIYFTRITEVSTTQIESQLTEQLNIQQQRITIEAVDNGEVITIRNIGSATIPNETIATFIDNTLVPCDFVGGDIAAGSVRSCNLTTSGSTILCAASSSLRVSAPGGSDTYTC